MEDLKLGLACAIPTSSLTHIQTHLTQIAMLKKQLEDRIQKNLTAEKQLERKLSVCQESVSLLASVALS